MNTPAGRPLAAEFTGTFMMVLCGCGAIVVNALTGGVPGHLAVSAVWGLIVMTMIYALGAVSGAHLNPAVTLAFAAAGRCPWRRVLPYWFAQSAGALAAAGILRLLFPGCPAALGATLPRHGSFQAAGVEFLLALILMYVILGVASGAREQGLMAGVAVGAVILLEAAFAGPLTGASMNPARSLAPALISGDAAARDALWLYFAGPLLGTLSAVPLQQFTHGPGPRFSPPGPRP